MTGKAKGSAKGAGAGKSGGAAKGALQAGDRAPDFDLPADDGSRVRLKGLRGKKVVLFFYPKDNTPGCTIEACDFRDALPRVSRAGAMVLGISADSPASHRKFKEKFGLTYPLLADEDHAVCEAYGVWKKKKNFGRIFSGIERSTFLIDEAGKVERVWRKVSARGHAEEVAAAL